MTIAETMVCVEAENHRWELSQLVARSHLTAFLNSNRKKNTPAKKESQIYHFNIDENAKEERITEKEKIRRKEMALNWINSRKNGTNK